VEQEYRNQTSELVGKRSMSPNMLVDETTPSKRSKEESNVVPFKLAILNQK